MDKFAGYKTVVFFGLVLVVQVANLLGFGDFVFSAEQQDILGVVIPLVGLVLRYLTKTPLFNKSQG